MQLKATRQLKEIIEQLAKAKKARESGRSDRNLKALELKLAECQSMVDEVDDPPLKFLKATERVKLVPPTTHRLGEGGIPGLKATFVSTLPLLHFFLQRFVSVESHRTVWDTFCDANCIAKMCQMAFSSQRYDVICFANCFARYSMRKSALRKRVRRLEQIANCFAS